MPRNSASGSQPTTVPTPPRRAASATDAPMRPVPTTARRPTLTRASSPHRPRGSCGPHQLGDAEREVERLPRVEPGVAERLVPVVELVLRDRLGAAEALRHVLPGDLEVDAARPAPDLAVRLEEALDLPQDVVEPPRLVPGRRRERVRVHRV